MKAVLFDLDGVLIDSYATWFHLSSACAVAFGHPPISEAAYAKAWGQSVADDCAMFYGGLDLDTVNTWLAAHHHEHLEHTALDPDTLAVIDALRARGVKTAVCTNTPQPLAGQILAHLGIRPDALVAEGEVPAPKPAPDMLLRALELLGVDAAEAWMVGDSRFDAAAAEAAGVRFAGMRRDGLVRLERLGEVLEVLS